MQASLHDPVPGARLKNKVRRLDTLVIMKPRDLFGLAVRLVALWFLSKAAVGAAEATSALFGNATGSTQGASAEFSVGHGVGICVANLLIALWFLFGAWPFARWAYPPPKPTERTTDEA